MANQSEKKNQLKNSGRVKYLKWAALAISLWYLLFELMTMSILTFKGIILLAVIGGINYFCYKQIVKSWDYQLPP
jgi:hypothetical protein